MLLSPAGRPSASVHRSSANLADRGLPGNLPNAKGHHEGPGSVRALDYAGNSVDWGPALLASGTIRWDLRS
jgi:hypothetical protein